MAKDTVKLTTPPFIACFPNAFKARPGGKNGTGKLKYGLTALWLDPDAFPEQDKKKWVAILKALSAESVAAFGKKWSELNPAVYRTGIRKNSDREEPFEHPNITPRAMFANITSDYKPGVCDINGNDVGPELGNEDLLYPGCLCRATVNAYSFKNEGKGVAIGLNNIMILSSNVAKYPRLDNRKGAAEDFDDDVDSSWLGEDDEPEVDSGNDGGDGGY
jgi:hypothetical protein